MPESYTASSINQLYTASPHKDEVSSSLGIRSRITQTDKRIEEIKRKYDTPNRRERLSSQLSSAKKSQYIPVKADNYKNKQNSQKPYSHQEGYNQKSNSKSIISSQIGNSRVSRNPLYDRDYLKESTAINRSRNVEDKNMISSQVNNQHKNVYSRQTKKYETNACLNNEQQQFFKKVKQMKQSLLYSDAGNYRDTSGISKDFKHKRTLKDEEPTWNHGSYKSNARQQKSNSQFYESKNPGIERDRIDNIDKINEKIKGILECLNQNERVRPQKDGYNQKQRQRQRERQRNLKLQEIQRENRRRFAYQDELKTSITPAKSANLSTSVIDTMQASKTNQFKHSKERFHHKQERSDLLQKIEITQPGRKHDVQDEKWEKLSNKLERYQVENKLRIQKALQNSKGSERPDQGEGLTSNQRFGQSYLKDDFNLSRKRENKFTAQNVFKPNSRSVYEPSRTIQAKVQDKSVDVAKGICTRSFVGSSSIKHRDLSVQPKHSQNYQLQKSGKKLDDQIHKLQQKIKQFEEEKKRMNIHFKPFNYSNTKSTSALQQHNYPKKYDLSERKISQFGKIAKSANKIEADKSCQKALDFHQRNTQKIQIKISRQTLKDNNLNNKAQQYSFQNGQVEDLLEKKKSRKYCDSQSDSLRKRDIQIKLQKSNDSSAKTSKFISRRSHDFEDQQQSYAVQFTTKQQIQQKKLSNRENAYFYDDELKKKTDSGIQERKRILLNGSNKQRPVKTDLKKLVQDLVKQVELDQQLRNNKIWLQCFSSVDKYTNLKKILANKFGIQKTEDEIHEMFKVRQTQNNPFFTAQGYTSSLDTLAEAYVTAQKHWNEHLLHRYNKEALINQGFTSKQIDLERKNFINLEDIVRFLNLQSGTFYRNRDLAIVFMRIGQGAKKEVSVDTTFNKLLDTFCD